MSLFVSGCCFCGSQSCLCLFLVQQLTSESPSANATETLDIHFHITNTHTYRHAGTQTHFILKQLWKCDREVGCAKLIMWRVRTLLNGASLVSPCSEVTLSFQSVLQMNWTLCQRWSSLVKQKSECEATLPAECPFTILLSSTFIILTDWHTFTHCMLYVCPGKQTLKFMEALLVHADEESDW